MPKCLIIAGCSASGKSTLAKMFVEEDGYKELNRDYIRFHWTLPGGDWTTYDFNEDNETETQRVWMITLNQYIEQKTNFVISDTNTKKKDRNRLKNKLLKAGYDVMIVVLNDSLETLVERDKQRGVFSVGRDVIEKQKQVLEN